MLFKIVFVIKFSRKTNKEFLKIKIDKNLKSYDFEKNNCYCFKIRTLSYKF